MSSTSDLLDNNARYVAEFDKVWLSPSPAKRVAVLACMDARLDPAKILGLNDGDAHVIRNAGGVASQDAVRSLVISQRLLGTEEIILIHHTDCGMESIDETEFTDEIFADTGHRPEFAFEAFSDVDDDVRHTAALIVESPLIPKKSVRGFVYEVETGRLREIVLDRARSVNHEPHRNE
jgi:carbonic anhydrase